MTWLALSTALLYTALWLALLLNIMGKAHINTRYLKLAIAGTILVHAIFAIASIASKSGVDLGLFKIAVLLFAIINGLLIISSIKKPVLSLFILLLPLSVIALITFILFAQRTSAPIDLSLGIAAHILSSLVAYSLLTIASIQSILYAYQEHKLKHHSAGKVLRILPPLQTMDSLLFNVIWIGVALLGVSILSGVIFIDDIFAQQLAHKTVFSLLSLAIYSVLLWGRHQFGWRGMSAIKWVLTGFCLLMLAYFGTKFVVELLLSNN